MKQLYAIGNALVDTEIKLSPEALSDLQIEKGVMTLIDDTTMATRQSQFKDTDKVKACGGSAANSLITASGLGTSCFFSSQVANDDNGQFYTADLERQSIKSNLQPNTLPDGTTGTCFVMVTPDADRTMNTYLGISATLTRDVLDEIALKRSYIYYMEGYLVTSETGKDAAIRGRELATQNQVKTAITLSDPGIVSYFKDGLKEMIGSHVDYLFCNEAEALAFADTTDLESAAKTLQSIASTVIITIGEKGALIYEQNTTHKIPGIPVNAIDTNGAGDAFAGAFLAGVCQNKSSEESGKLGCLAASQVVTVFGPRLSEEHFKVMTQTSKLAI